MPDQGFNFDPFARKAADKRAATGIMQAPDYADRIMAEIDSDIAGPYPRLAAARSIADLQDVVDANGYFAELIAAEGYADTPLSLAVAAEVNRRLAAR
jgi:hypothetical protein